jgi:hypothetical protein
VSRRRGDRRLPRGRLSILGRIQLGLEALYRVETQLAIDAFVIDEEQRNAASPARTPREQLLVKQEADALALALFVDAGVLANLERHDPAVTLDEDNFSDFCLAVEGVSHFIYVALRAARERPVSPLELELQAEVDKFACCVLVAGANPSLRRQLYGGALAEDLASDERERYWTANHEASRYAGALERRFTGRVGALVGELRAFYRLGLAEKLSRIAMLA